MKDNLPEKRSEILIYQTEDGRTRIEVRLEDETVWLSQAQLSELFDKNKRTISEHIRNIFKEGELLETSVVRKFRTTATDGKFYSVTYYNLDVIISVGYRVKSHRGTQFRIWATQRLREFIVKGFTLDDERLKQAGSGNYFEELLARIRDIRASEKVFWRKVLDIYATSIDYDPKTDLSRDFFSIVQNKMHWAAHGHTAAEIVADRADASQPNIGLTSWSGAKLTKEDVEIAKNRSDILQPVSLPYLRVANVQDGFLDLREIKKITLEEQDVKRYLLRSGDVLFTEGGDFDKLGRGSIWKNEISPCLHQNHVFAVRCKKSLLLPFFLSAVASGPHGRKYFLLSSKQSTNLASINSTQLKKFPIPLPPLSEQIKITEILSTWDTATEQTRELIDAKKSLKKALMQQLLTGKKRLPGFEGDWKSYYLKI